MYIILNNDLHLMHGDIKIVEDGLYVTRTDNSIKKDLSNANFINCNQINNIIINKVEWAKSYILTYDDHIEEYSCDDISCYTFDYLKNHNVRKLTSVNLYPNKSIVNYLDKNIKSYCEIGVRYGATSSYVLDFIYQHNLDISMHLFEYDILYYNFLNEKYKNDLNCHVYFGDAAKTLKKYNNEKFDIVYFDASHKYDSDKRILDNLIQYLNDQCIIIFDDYKLDGVKKLVDEFELIYKDKFNIIKD